MVKIIGISYTVYVDVRNDSGGGGEVKCEWFAKIQREKILKITIHSSLVRVVMITNTTGKN